MKEFILKMPAYHFLEKNHHVCISESGDMVTERNSRVRYYIVLNEKIHHWTYYRFTNKRDKYGDFTLIEPSSICRVYAGFDQVGKFNRH